MCTNEFVTNPKTRWPNSKNNRPVVLLDMDDVITSCLRAVVKAYNEVNGTHFSPAKCDAWDLTKLFGCSLEEVMTIFRTPGFFENLPPKKGAIGAIRELIKSTKYDLYIVTATSDDDGSELVEKIAWFKKYLPEFNTKRIISCQEKHLIRGDVLVDDKVENLRLAAPYMSCILMDSPTNQDCTEFIRISRLKELPALLDEMFYNDSDGIKHFEKEIAPAIIEAQNSEENVEINEVVEKQKKYYNLKYKAPAAKN